MSLKKIISMFICLCAANTISSCSYAENIDDIKVTVNGEYIEFDQPPVIIDDRTMVPVRKIFEKLGAEVKYDEKTSTVYASKTGFELSMRIGDDKYILNNTEKYLDVPAMIINDRTLVPVRAVSESMDCNVEWDNSKRTVVIFTDNTKEGGTLEVHFIDVGQADSALLKCGGKTMLIDGGNAADSNTVVAYLKKNDVDYLDYMVCTHAHEDHVGGLSGPLSVMDVGTIYAPVTEESTKAYLNFKNKAEQKNIEMVHPSCGEVFYLGDGKVEILGPVSENTNNLNDTSIVMKVSYGENSFLFTGDAEKNEEWDIINKDYDLKSDVLKVGHHGSENSSSYLFLREIMPKYSIISVGKDNKYSHPSETLLSRLRDIGSKVYRTDMQGDIIAVSDGKNIIIKTQKNSDIQTNPTERDKTADNSEQNSIVSEDVEENSDRNEMVYIGNKNTKKFHKSSCVSLPAEKNRVEFQSRDDALNQGYTSCLKCNP
ncbi:MAG: stalk domain-containing protein [Clostridia bacterium]|nr:stalk domain-containing protein [Clostridia bacterium]